MTSGNRSRAKLLFAALAASPLACGAPSSELNALVQRLARPAPAAIAFTEVRFSPLLKAPLIVSGELGYEGPSSLERRVSSPYRETTTIRGDAVRVEREGEPARSFSSARAPELRGLLDSFSALLAGDVALLERSFEVSAREQAAQWRIELTPKDARTRRRIKSIVIEGASDAPRCVTMLNAERGAGVILLGDAPGELAAPDATFERLEQYCASGALASTSGGGARGRS